MEPSQRNSCDNQPTKESTMNAHTNTEIATSYSLWVEFFDTDGSMT